VTRVDRMLAGSGFAIFTQRPTFTFETLDAYFRADPSISHVLYVPNAATHVQTTDAIERLARAHNLIVSVSPWETYGTPANVASVAALPSDSLAIILADQRRTIGNRLDVRRGYMRRKAARKRIVVDVLPYEVAPWRVYFPFAFFDRSLLGYHHSYAIEQDYDRWLDGGLPQNPCDAERIASLTWKGAIVDRQIRGLPTFFAKMLLVSAEHHAEYAAFRDGLFASEKSITSVKTKLARWITERYPGRTIPHDMRHLYGRAEHRFVRTDLPFDEWLSLEVDSLVTHTNRLLDAYLRHQSKAGEP